MGSRVDKVHLGAAPSERDESWHEEADAEMLRSLAEVERSTVLSNFVGTALLVAVSQLLPNASDFLWPAVMRAVAISFTAVLYANIRKRIAGRQRLNSVLPLCSLASIIGGASWAMLLAPVFIDPVIHPASFIVASGILIAVSLVASMIAALVHSWAAFGASFLFVFWFNMLEAPSGFALGISIGVGLLYAAVATYSLGLARQRKIAAETLVENRRLGEDLAEALAQAEFLAYRDSLTGLFNRRAFFELVANERARGAMQHVMLIDIDHFKQVNDQFGHDVGDRMLVSIGQCLRDILRSLPGDDHCAARLGGEEFAIFLDTAERKNADDAAERIRAGIADTAREYSLPEGVGTASIGVSVYQTDEGISDALRRADDALYDAKKAGRGIVLRNDP